MSRRLNSYLIPYACFHRYYSTRAESLLWNALKGKSFGLRCRREAPIGPYIADFLFARAKLIIEVDGGHHYSPEYRLKDAIRTKNLEQRGYAVIRFTNEQVFENMPLVLASIKQVLPERFQIGLQRFLVPLQRVPF